MATRPSIRPIMISAWPIVQAINGVRFIKPHRRAVNTAARVYLAVWKSIPFDNNERLTLSCRGRKRKISWCQDTARTRLYCRDRDVLPERILCFSDSLQRVSVVRGGRLDVQWCESKGMLSFAIVRERLAA
jgi:hypothetical protein